ncbi:hypothetical protein CC85DRAFT_327782 [Cutaneotrichosporon oleaginosum]|uniref:Uncharacterized protein n=1 Tax=Cutaneotrichosporon oleaginosum TaxID=879819 RepID=A0A0J0XPB4_9TREE|nr:uncharacterized protein CC85DRAFT_327782 [Cutaneotrichosporon oleaginosum]KLT42902.1 hypothetical protein CC85DRAFT_327782 [Cutaneotrichosporon oleaginosum]TXT12606.1 hypothetical protein COLE_03016 [Cutaneotrichosporon oleaginosum]
MNRTDTPKDALFVGADVSGAQPGIASLSADGGMPEPARAKPIMEPASEDAGDTTEDTDWKGGEAHADVQPHKAKKQVGERTGMGPALF